jgi:hypothetical protein
MLKGYPRNIFSSMWNDLEKAIKSGQIVSPEAVKRELLVYDDEIAKWAKGTDGLFHDPTDEVLERVGKLMKSFPDLINHSSDRDQADPYVIAVAQEVGAIIVTEETSKRSNKKAKIPGVCKELNISCMNLFSMLESFGWKY